MDDNEARERERRGHPNSRNTTFRPVPPPSKFFLTLEEMLRIAFDVGSGLSDRETSVRQNRSPTTVGNVRRRIFGENAPRTNSDYTPELLAHFVAFSLLDNPQATGEAIAKAAGDIGLATSKSSVNRLASDMRFQSIFAQKTEKLSPRHKEYRQYFAQNIFTWDSFQLPWVFTDESMIAMNATRKKIRVVRGIEMEEKYTELAGYPLKIMVWAAIAHGFKSQLIFFEGKVTADSYQKVLADSQIFEKLNHRFGNRAFVFQQDGARPHTASSTRRFLDTRAITLPDHLHWPAMSPDLNVIENLWSLLKHRIDYRNVTDIKSLKREAVRVWDQISLDVVDNCVQDFYPRLRACDALAGAALNQHKFVLRAFRRSSSDGMLALAESTTERLQITLFCDASRDFFRDEAPKHVPMRKLPASNGQPDAERENWRLCNESARICTLLPQRIRDKTGLPRGRHALIV